MVNFVTGNERIILHKIYLNLGRTWPEKWIKSTAIPTWTKNVNYPRWASTHMQGILMINPIRIGVKYSWIEH